MDQQVKERVVGAAVLVLAAVIFIPMILAGSPPQGAGGSYAPGLAQPSAQTSAARVASVPDDSEFSSRIVPLGKASPANGAARQIALEHDAKRVREAGTEAATALPVNKAVQWPPIGTASPKPGPETMKAAAQPPAGHEPSVARTPQTGNAGWVVQLGSFASARNAHALRDRLKAKGYKAFARSSRNGGEAVTRVYVGPDAERESAQRLVARLFGETRLQGIVIRDPG